MTYIIIYEIKLNYSFHISKVEKKIAPTIQPFPYIFGFFLDQEVIDYGASLFCLLTIKKKKKARKTKKKKIVLLLVRVVTGKSLFFMRYYSALLEYLDIAKYIFLFFLFYIKFISYLTLGYTILVTLTFKEFFPYIFCVWKFSIHLTIYSHVFFL